MPHTYQNLTPEILFTSFEDQGYMPTGIFYQLNSYENRVYEVHLEGHEPLIAKYYRPERWSVDQLGDEHRFIQALTDVEIPAIAPLPLKQATKNFATLGKIADYFYAFFPKFRGREHDELSLDDRKLLGHFMGRLHNVGATFKTSSRLPLNPQTYGDSSLKLLLKNNYIPIELQSLIHVTLDSLLESIKTFFKGPANSIAVHGDCHLGNILWNKSGPHLVDFDDMVLAPAVQDIWMLFSGSPEEIAEQQKVFFEAYETFREFDYGTLRLIEPLRTLRMIRHAAWIGERYEEPIFKKAFPYYNDHRYWQEFLLHMKEQLSLLQES